MKVYGIIPGLGNSGPEHWQTYFENQGNNYIRIQQNEWDAPECSDWIQNVQQFVDQYSNHEIVLVGHSLGCVTIAQWAKKFKVSIRGALLVAPSDIENPVYTFPATGFSPIPLEPLEFKSVVVASSNDVWVSQERAAYFASKWNSEMINIGEGGHINAASGHYKWDQGLEILHSI